MTEFEAIISGLSLETVFLHTDGQTDKYTVSHMEVTPPQKQEKHPTP